MSEKTVRQLAEVVGIPLDKLLEQMKEAGLKGNAAEDLVFYDDVRFKIENESPRNDLMASFKDRVEKTGNSNLVIYADQAVSHGTILTIMNLAKQAGVANVNMATSPL